MIAVPQIGEEEDGHVNHVPKSLLVGIIAPRLEETFELVRDRLEASGLRQDRRPPRRPDRRRLPAAGRARAGRRSSSTSRSASAGRCASRAWPRRPTGRPFRRPPGSFISRCPERAEIAARRRALPARRAACSAGSATGCARIFEPEFGAASRSRRRCAHGTKNGLHRVRRSRGSRTGPGMIEPRSSGGTHDQSEHPEGRAGA